MKHLLAIGDLDRADIERIMRARRELRRGRAARHQEGPDPSRPHDRQPLLRVEHAHQLLVRARRQAPLGRRRLDQVERLVGRQGRVAEGHDRHARRLRPGGDRHPLARTPAPPTSSRAGRDAAVVNAGDGKHEHPSQALLDTYTLRRRLGSLEGKKIWIVGDVLHSRVARSCVLAFRLMGAQVTVCGPPTLIPAGRRGRPRLRVALRRSTASRRPTSSTRCACSASGCASPSCPRSASTRPATRSTRAAWARASC